MGWVDDRADHEARGGLFVFSRQCASLRGKDGDGDFE